MSVSRILTNEERALIATLLRLQPDTIHFLGALDNLLVQEMADGGMGSLLLIPEGVEKATRSFGRQVVAGEFTDSDGVPVSVTINIDRDNKLYELDVWKVNFDPLLHWPNPSAIKIAD